MWMFLKIQTNKTKLTSKSNRKKKNKNKCQHMGPVYQALRTRPVFTIAEDEAWGGIN